MKKTNLTMRLFSLMLVLVIVAAMAFTLASCGNTNDGGSDTDTNTVSDTAADTADDTDAAKDTADADTSGEEKSEITITVQVKGSDGNTTDFVITTDAEFLRGALEDENLIQGDESEYGLYVKVVNGETADYDANGAYWSFYKGDEYLMTGVDTTPIADGDIFRIEYTIG